MHIQFHDDPLSSPRSREEVRFNRLGIYVFEEGRRIAVGFDITPFLERPSIQVTIKNEAEEDAGSLHIIEAMEANFNVTMHLRDENPTKMYQIEAVIYYPVLEENSPDETAQKRETLIVDRIVKPIDISITGDQ